jgi:hypothetical protein
MGLDINPLNLNQQTAVLLSRIDQLEQNIIAGKTENATQLLQLFQRQFTTLVCRKQAKIESHCPSVFALRHRDSVNWKKGYSGRSLSYNCIEKHRENGIRHLMTVCTKSKSPPNGLKSWHPKFSS